MHFEQLDSVCLGRSLPTAFLWQAVSLHPFCICMGHSACETAQIPISLLAERLAEAYDLFQAGKGWKCELENPPEPSCGSYRAMLGVEKMDV